MPSANDSPRIHSVNEVYREDATNQLVFLHTAVVAFDGDVAYYGTTTAREKDIDQQTILKSLEAVRSEDIYPRFDLNMLKASPDITHEDGLYVKVPNLSTLSSDASHEIPRRLLHEAKIYEKLRKHPHRSLGKSLGCILSSDGLITGLALVKYKSTLFERAHDLFYDKPQRALWVAALEEGVRHLHGLGLAHNDLSPLNIMFTDDGEPVILDFDTCHPFGTELTKGGRVGEWEGLPVAVYQKSSVECDEHSLRYIGTWLEKKYDEVQALIQGGSDLGGIVPANMPQDTY